MRDQDGVAFLERHQHALAEVDLALRLVVPVDANEAPGDEAGGDVARGDHGPVELGALRDVLVGAEDPDRFPTLVVAALPGADGGPGDGGGGEAQGEGDEEGVLAGEHAASRSRLREAMRRGSAALSAYLRRGEEAVNQAIDRRSWGLPVSGQRPARARAERCAAPDRRPASRARRPG